MYLRRSFRENTTLRSQNIDRRKYYLEITIEVNMTPNSGVIVSLVVLMCFQ